MIRRPPRSTLFPTRRSSDLGAVEKLELLREQLDAAGAEVRIDGARRSEEHTSELQSPCNLVCRLLLEKKKKKRINSSRHARRMSPTSSVSRYTSISSTLP